MKLKKLLVYLNIKDAKKHQESNVKIIIVVFKYFIKIIMSSDFRKPSRWEHRPSIDRIDRGIRSMTTNLVASSRCRCEFGASRWTTATVVRPSRSARRASTLKPPKFCLSPIDIHRYPPFIVYVVRLVARDPPSLSCRHVHLISPRLCVPFLYCVEFYLSISIDRFVISCRRVFYTGRFKTHVLRLLIYSC